VAIAQEIISAAKDIIKGYIESLKKRIELSAVFLFGSWARGKAGRRSDIDLLVISDDLPLDMHKRLDILFDEKPLLIDTLGFRKDEIMDLMHRHFLLKAISEGKVVYGDEAWLKKRAEEYIKENNLIPTSFGYTHG
jgi:predicted nucleotidyltransferase